MILMMHKKYVDVVFQLKEAEKLFAEIGCQLDAEWCQQKLEEITVFNPSFEQNS